MTPMADHPSCDTLFATMRGAWLRRRLFSAAVKFLAHERCRDDNDADSDSDRDSDRDAALIDYETRMREFDDAPLETQNTLFAMTAAMLRQPDFIDGVNDMVARYAELERKQKLRKLNG